LALRIAIKSSDGEKDSGSDAEGDDNGGGDTALHSWAGLSHNFKIRSGNMDFLEQLVVATASSLVTAFVLWLVARYKPIADWINEHGVTSGLIGLAIVYLAALGTTLYQSWTLRQELAVWSAITKATATGDMNCPDNMYMTGVSLPIINNAGFVGRGSVICRPLNVHP
jgi:hypothetical protein